jgi:hypothetical protein
MRIDDKRPPLALTIAAASFGVALLTAGVHGQIAVRNPGFVPFSDEPIFYRGEVHDPGAELQRRLDRGETTLRYEPRNGYLESVLDHLGISATSQTLVFSKTSFQYRKISPATPRALYFNDDVYVGKIREGKAIELVSFDPRQGAIFYLLDEHQTETPKFERAELDCTVCHVSPATRNVPGVLIRSIYPTATGTVARFTPSYITGNASPLAERFGGWYVTGRSGAQRHLGNVTVDRKDPLHLDRDAGANVTDLSGRFDVSGYLTPYSDIVAQLLQAHQTQAHNLITLTNYETRLALYEARQEKGSKESVGGLSRAARARIERPAEALVRYLLFADEAPLAGEVTGTSGFTEEFSTRGPRDSRGRSLREFDLHTRLFKYPLSYLIYTDAFDAMPAPAKGYVYRRLHAILTAEEGTDEFWNLSGRQRQAILEILLETKKGLPDDWKTANRRLRSEGGAPSANRTRHGQELSD